MVAIYHAEAIFFIYDGEASPRCASLPSPGSAYTSLWRYICAPPVRHVIGKSSTRRGAKAVIQP
jgi:hypothetical protein